MSELTAADLSIVIPTRERWEILAATLAALEAQTVERFETIVVVDGSDQQIPELPEERVLQQEHTGPRAARNRGVRATERRPVLFTRDHMLPRPGLAARHLALH